MMKEYTSAEERRLRVGVFLITSQKQKKEHGLSNFHLPGTTII